MQVSTHRRLAIALFLLACLVIAGGLVDLARFVETSSSAPANTSFAISTISLVSPGITATYLDMDVVSTPIPATPTLPEPTFTPTPVFTPTPTIHPWVEQQLASMTLQQKIGQMMMIGVGGQMSTPDHCWLIGTIAPGAIVYVSSNVNDPEQLKDFSDGLQQCANRKGVLPLFTALDHEGQYVYRFKQGATIFPPAMAIGATGDPQWAYQVAFAAGQELAYSGVNMVLGPVADVLTNYDNTVISERSFGSNPEEVAQFVAQAVAGYLDAGITPVLKHFPGHGNVAEDSHDVLPVDLASPDELAASHLLPFQSGIQAGASGVMTAHVTFPVLEPDGNPATLSSSTLHLLNDLGFQGFTLSDSMSMKAISPDVDAIPDTSVQAVNAGVDMLLIVSNSAAQAVQARLLEAVQLGEITEERVDQAVRHILEVKVSAGLEFSPQHESSVPDWQEDRDISFQAGYHAVSLLRNEAGLVPIPETVKRILVVGPTDGWGLYPRLHSAFGTRSYTYNIVIYSGPWSGPVSEQGYLQTIPTQTAGYDLIIFFTWEAHLNRFRYGDAWQSQLVNAVIDNQPSIIVIALKSPTDLLEFPQASTYLATYGTTAGQLQGIVDALMGTWQPTGISPLSGIP